MIGSSSAIAAAGPIPGSTPTTWPSKHAEEAHGDVPRRQRRGEAAHQQRERLHRLSPRGSRSAAARRARPRRSRAARPPPRRRRGSRSRAGLRSASAKSTSSIRNIATRESHRLDAQHRGQRRAGTPAAACAARRAPRGRGGLRNASTAAASDSAISSAPKAKGSQPGPGVSRSHIGMARAPRTQTSPIAANPAERTRSPQAIRRATLRRAGRAAPGRDVPGVRGTRRNRRRTSAPGWPRSPAGSASRPRSRGPSASPRSSRRRRHR